MRTFDTGATRDSNENKPNYIGFLSPEVLEKYGQYMLSHQKQADGQLRAADNWKRGIPRQAYIESMARHFVELWVLHQGAPAEVGAMDEALYALLFNVMGYAYELEMGR